MRPSASTGISSVQALGQSCGQADLAMWEASCCMQGPKVGDGNRPTVEQPIDVILSANSPCANTSRPAESLLDHSGGDFACQIARPIGKFIRLPHKRRLTYAYSGKRNMLTKVSALVLVAMHIAVAGATAASAGPALLIDAT